MKKVTSQISKSLTQSSQAYKDKATKQKFEKFHKQSKDINHYAPGEIIRLQKVEEPVYESQKQSYNPFRRANLNLDKLSAKSFITSAQEEEKKMNDEGESKQNEITNTIDAQQAIEMKFIHHNAEGFYQDKFLCDESSCSSNEESNCSDDENNLGQGYGRQQSMSQKEGHKSNASKQKSDAKSHDKGK